MTAEQVAAEPESAPGHASWRSIPALALVPLAALTWWVVGFLPWLVNDTGREVLDARGISTLTLPLVGGGVGALVLGAGLGGVAAGLTACLGAGSRIQRAGASAAGVALALFGTLLQSRSAVSGVAGVDGRLINGLTAIVVLTALVGLGLGLLGVTGRVGLGFAVGAAAGAIPMWVMNVCNALELDTTAGRVELAHGISEWAGVVALAVALVLVGLQPTARAAAWPAIVLMAWFIEPTITAAGYLDAFLRPGMRFPEMWGDHLSATLDVWQMAASPKLRSLTQWIVAIIVAGGIALWLARRPSAEPAQPAQ
jgi:hypothetical protein